MDYGEKLGVREQKASRKGFLLIALSLLVVCREIIFLTAVRDRYDICGLVDAALQLALIPPRIWIRISWV